jgi:hypothetical protein
MNKSFKNTYRLGMLVFIITTLFASIIFGAMFRSCSSEPVVNVNVMDRKNESVHDTFYMDREVTRVIRDTVRIQIKPVVIPTVKPVVKPTVIPKTDTASK